MVRCASLFSQFIALFSRQQFYGLVIKQRSERYAKRYNSWDHFVAMLFCQLAQAKSLRDLWRTGLLHGQAAASRNEGCTV
jgi:hypothetical protein